MAWTWLSEPDIYLRGDQNLEQFAEDLLQIGGDTVTHYTLSH